MKPTLLKKYWATWRSVREQHIAAGMSPTEAEAQRDVYCIRAHGQAISASIMTDDQAGDVLKEFALVVQPDDLQAQLAPTSGEARKRAQLIWSIRKEQPKPTWAAGTSQDCFHRRDWENLPYQDLLTLRRRVANEGKGYVIPGGNSRRHRKAIGIKDAGPIVTADQEAGNPS